MAMIESRDRATSDPAARQRVLEEMRDKQVEYVLFWFTDLEGHLKSFAITPVRDRGGARRRHGLRRLVDHGLQRDRGVGHGRDPRPRDLPADAERRRQGRPDDLRHRQAGRLAVRGRPALRAPPGARADGEDGLRHLQRRPRARVLPLRGRREHDDARRGRLLRDDDDGRRHRAPQRHDQGARVDGHPDRVPPPRGRALAARDRHALRGRARHGRPHDHLPADREGGREEGRLPRDLHAEAALRRERLGHAHPHVALQRGPERVLRRRTTSTTSRRTARRSSPACCATPASSRPSSRSGSTPTSGSCRATRRRCTWRGRSGTARR